MSPESLPQHDPPAPYADSMTVSAHDVAAEIRRRMPSVGVKKLHKLLYYCQGHHLATFGTPLYREEIHAWDMGPVVSQLWRDERDGVRPEEDAALDEAKLNTIGYVLSRYGANTGNDLELLTHSEMPWQRANSFRRPKGSVRIEREWIREFFATDGAADGDDEDTVLDSTVISQWLEGAEERRQRPAQPDDLEEIRARLARA